MNLSISLLNYLLIIFYNWENHEDFYHKKIFCKNDKLNFHKMISVVHLPEYFYRRKSKKLNMHTF